MAEVLRAAGLDCLVCPLIAVSPTDQPLPGDCFQHVIFVSEHAVQRGRAAVERIAAGAQWYAVGPATGAALAKLMAELSRSEAANVQMPADPRSEGLLREPGLQTVEGACVLLVAGEGGRELIAETLRARGARVTSWLVYRRIELDLRRASTDLNGVWKNESGDEPADEPAIDVCVASSGAGLELLTRSWFGHNNGSGWGIGRQVPVCVPSPRIAQMATAMGWQAPVLCNGASAEATLEGLVNAGLMPRPCSDENDQIEE